jgi:hypothetical protein
MSVKRVSGGGGQGRRPGREVKGHTFFGERFSSDDDPNHPKLVEIEHAQGALARIRELLSRQPASEIGSEIARWQLARADYLGQVLADATETLSRRFKAARDINKWDARLFAGRPARKRATRPVSEERPKKPRAVKVGRLGGFSAPDTTAGGVRQRLYRLLDLGPEKFGIQRSELEADISKLARGKDARKIDTVTTTIRKKYVHLFVKLRR